MLHQNKISGSDDSRITKTPFRPKNKLLVTFVIIATLLFSFFAFVPGQSSNLANG